MDIFIVFDENNLICKIFASYADALAYAKKNVNDYVIAKYQVQI